MVICARRLSLSFIYSSVQLKFAMVLKDVTKMKKIKVGMVTALIMALAMPVSVGVLAVTTSVKAEAADFTGKIRRVKIKRSTFGMTVLVQGDAEGQLATALAVVDGQKDPVKLNIVGKASAENTRLIGQLNTDLPLENEVRVLVTLLDSKGGVLLRSREIVKVDAAPEAIFYSLTIKSRLTAEPIANVIMAAPSKESLLELAALSDQNKDYYAEAQALNADEVAVLTPEKYTIAGGAFSAQGNLLNVVTEAGRLFSFTAVSTDKLQSFNLKGDWNTAWENPIFQGEVQTAVNAMFE